MFVPVEVAILTQGHLLRQILITANLKMDRTLDMEKNVPFDLTVTFSEEVNDFSLDDLTVELVDEPDVTSATPIAAVTLKSGVPGDDVYVVTVTPICCGG